MFDEDASANYGSLQGFDVISDERHALSPSFRISVKSLRKKDKVLVIIYLKKSLK